MRGLVHLDSHSARVLAHKDCETDEKVQNLIWLEIFKIDLLKFSELVIEEVHRTGELGTSFLKLMTL